MEPQDSLRQGTNIRTCLFIRSFLVVHINIYNFIYILYTIYIIFFKLYNFIINLIFLDHKRQTYTGSILVAVNPYKMFDIYGLDQVKLYEGRILGTLPP